MVCIELNLAESFEPVIDNWGACADENTNSGTILSFDVVYVGSPVIIMLQ